MLNSATAFSARVGGAVVAFAAVCATATACSGGGPEQAASSGRPTASATAARGTATAAATVTPATATPTTARPSAKSTPARLRTHLPRQYDSRRAAWRAIDAALKKSAVDHQPVLIDFGAAWCPSCAELDRSFQAPEVQALVRPLHRVRVDTGPQYAAINLDVATAYGLDLAKTGIPGLVLLAPDGRVEATTNDGLFDSDRPNSPDLIIGFLKPHL